MLAPGRIVDRMQQQPDGSFACDLTDAELVTVLRVGSERQVRRLLSPRAEPSERLCGPYPRLVTWHRRALALEGVDAPVHHQPRTFVWHGDTRTADEISSERERAVEPPRLINLAEAAAVLLAQQQSAPAVEPAADAISPPLSVRDEYKWLVANLRTSNDPARLLDRWESREDRAPFVPRLRSDADVQAILLQREN